MVRDMIRHWLGVPTRQDIREIALREIDADWAWQVPSDGRSLEGRRVDRRCERNAAILFHNREDTRG